MFKTSKQVYRFIWALIATFAVLATATVVFLVMSSFAKNEIIEAHETASAFDSSLHRFRSDAFTLKNYSRDFIITGDLALLANYTNILYTRSIHAEAAAVFYAHDATYHEMALFDSLVEKRYLMLHMELAAIGLLVSGDHAAASTHLFVDPSPIGLTYTQLMTAFNQTMDELHTAITYRTRDMVYQAESRAIAYDSMAVVITTIFAAIAVFGTISLLGMVRTASRRERHATDKNRMLIDGLPMFLEIWNHRGQLIDVSRKTLETFGVLEKSDYMTRYFDFMPPTQPCGRPSDEKLAEYVNLALEHGYSRCEWAHIDVHGNAINVETQFTRITVGGRDQIVGYSFDLTAIKQLHAAQQEMRAFNNMLIDASPFVISLWDTSATMYRTNSRTKEYFGAPSEEYFIEHFSEFSPETQPCGIPSSELAKSYVAQAFETGYAQFEWMHNTLDGEPLPTLVTCARLHWKGEAMLVC